MWVTKAEIGDRELREIFLDFGRVYLGRGKPQGRREDRETVPYMARSPAHAPAGSLWAVGGAYAPCRPYRRPHVRLVSLFPRLIQL